MIFITGANGWLGLNLVSSIVTGESEKWGLDKDKITAFIMKGSSRKRLLKISKDLRIIEGDIRDINDINDFLSNSKEKDILFHTAGVIHPQRNSDFFSINRDGTKNLLESLKKSKVRKAIIISSNSPCGCNKTNDELFDENSPYNPYMNYGKSKMEMEKIVNEYYNLGKVNSTIIRAPWFYGPFQPPRQKLFFEMIKKGKGPIIGDGNNKRSMVYTENLVQGMILCSNKEVASGNTYWISDEKPYSMNKIISTIEELLMTEFNQNCNLGRFCK